jgi:hypothetical protein
VDASLRFSGIIRVLVQHGVDFILVGGVAAILEGAPVSTFDVDVLVPREDDRKRLLAALQELNARYLDPAGRHIVPDLVKLDSLRMNRLVTDLGHLDVLTSIGNDLSYSDLVGETETYEVDGSPIRTLKLAMIIRSKEEANRDKDRAVLPILKRTLLLKQGRQEKY